MKILVVDDDSDLRGLLCFALRQAGYLPLEAEDGERALAVFEAERPALVILDVNMPKLDGFAVLQRLRATSRVPVLMLTVRASEEDQVRGLDLGADDYLAKPFSPRALLARLRALLRRSTGEEPPAPLVAGALTLDLEGATLRRDDAIAVRLTPLELRLLQLLFAHGGAPVPAERILLHVWGGRGGGDRQLLKQLVHRLRQKIEDDPAAPQIVLTAEGVGYALGGAQGASGPG